MTISVWRLEGNLAAEDIEEMSGEGGRFYKWII